MATREQMDRFHKGSIASTKKIGSGNYLRLGCTDFGIWTEEQIKVGVRGGVEYVDAREAKVRSPGEADSTALYADNASSCCILAGYRSKKSKLSGGGTLWFCKTFLSHVVDDNDTDTVKNALLDFQLSLNSEIEFYMFTMEGHLTSCTTLGANYGFAGAVGGLLKAYGADSLPAIARQTVIVTGYQGAEWNNHNCGVYVRPNGVFAVSAETPSSEFVNAPLSFQSGWRS